MHPQPQKPVKTNPCADLIKNADEVTRINDVVLPQVFEEIYRVLHNASARFKDAEIAKINTEAERLQREIDATQAKKDTLTAQLESLATA